MSYVIKVQPGIIPMGYGSFGEAVKGVKREGLDLVNGRVLGSYDFSGSELILRLDNGKCIRITIAVNRLCWSIEDGFQLKITRTPATDIIFEYADGLRESWCWKNKLDGLIGKKIVLSPSEQYLFLFSEKKDEYILDFVENTQDPSNKYLCIDDI